MLSVSRDVRLGLVAANERQLQDPLVIVAGDRIGISC